MVCLDSLIPKESEYDTVKTGHGGTSISTAMGFALAWGDQPENSERKAVAVIGDGSLQEGNAYEALNHGGMFKELNLLVVLNDNSMSISPSVGAMSRYLSRVRSSTWLNARLRTTQKAVKRIPRIGDDVEDVLQRWYHSIQGWIPRHALGIIFEELGFFYYGPIDGHDIDTLRQAFRATRWMRRPVLIHVVTKKGRGYKDDVPERTCYHAASPSKVEAIQVTREYPEQGGSSFTRAFAEKATEMVESDDRVIVITAAMIEGTGLVQLHERHPDRCLDVGMAEQHAVRSPVGSPWPASGRSAPSTRRFSSVRTTRSFRKWLCRRPGCSSASTAAVSWARTERRTTESSTSATSGACPTWRSWLPETRTSSRR